MARAHKRVMTAPPKINPQTFEAVASVRSDMDRTAARYADSRFMFLPDSTASNWRASRMEMSNDDRTAQILTPAWKLRRESWVRNAGVGVAVEGFDEGLGVGVWRGSVWFEIVGKRPTSP